MRAVVTFATLLLVPASAHAECAASGLVPTVLTPAKAEIPLDGAIVVAAIPKMGGSYDKGDAAVQSGWRIHVRGETLTPPIELVAPGLALYRVGVANAWDISLTDGSGAEQARVKATRSRRATLAAPNIKRAFFEQTPGRHATTRVGVELDAAPANAVALVLAAEDGTPRSWTTVAAGATTLYPYESPSCRALPNGTIASKAGDKIVLLWLDDAGKLSAPSKTITIAK